VSSNDIRLLELVAERLREIDLVFTEVDAGVCAIHLDACIAAMESRIAKGKAALRPA